jgi:cytochrome c oxidase assembly protein Cox11
MGSNLETIVDEYVDLQQCFCFEEQIYPPNEEINLPLSFTITPDLPEGIHTITFGYTLYPAVE